MINLYFNKAQMAIQQEIGNRGEKIAREYLRKNGYNIIEKNYRVEKSEIDIICKKENNLIFVEVKTRKSTNFGHPEEFVDEAKGAKVIEGAEAYIIEINWSGFIRFDIISILLLKDKVDIRHFKDAFY